MRYVAFIVDPHVGQLQMPIGAGACTVWDEGSTPIKTGLLNAAGVPLYRVPAPLQIGFHLKPKGL